MPSNIFNNFAGIIAIIAGIYMASAKAAGSNSLLETLINGIGWYCIARGAHMMSSTASLNAALAHLFEKQNADDVQECRVCMSKVHQFATKCRHCGSDLAGQR